MAIDPKIIEAETLATTAGQADRTELLDTDGDLLVRVGTPEAVTASGGAYVDFADASGETLRFNVDVPEAGFYDITVRYALGSTNDRPLQLDVNDQLVDRLFSFESTGADFTTYGSLTTRVQLSVGVNTIDFTSTGLSGPNIDSLTIESADPNTFVIQAETLAEAATNATPATTNRPITAQFLAAKNTAVGGTPETFRVGAEGDAYLDWGNNGASAAFSVETALAGKYAVSITYANGSTGARPLDLLLDDTAVGQFAVAPTPDDFLNTYYPVDRADLATSVLPSGPNASGWENWVTETIEINLAAGTNDLKLQLANVAGLTNGPNIDKIVLTLLPEAPTSLSVDDLTVQENLPGGVIGTVTVVDPNNDVTSITVDDARFEVVNNELKLKDGVALDFETASTVGIEIRAIDSLGLEFKQAVTVTVGDLPDTPPAAFNLALQAEDAVITEVGTPANTFALTRLGRVESAQTGLDQYGLWPGYNGLGYIDFGGSGDALTFTVNGIPAAGEYQIHIRYASSTGRPTNLAVNSGAATQLAFNSTDTDGSGPVNGFAVWGVQTSTVSLNAGANTIALTTIGATGPNIDAIAVTAPGGTPDFSRANAAPQFVGPTEVSFAENGTGVVLDLDASDGNGDPVRYAISGSDAAKFHVDAVTGAITFVNPPDFETPLSNESTGNVYQIDVSVTDTLATTTQSVAVTVTDVDDTAPVPFAPFEVQAEAGAITLAQTADASSTQVRDASNPESGSFTGLRPDFSGTGYVDFGNDAGDALTFTVTVPTAGQYDLNVRYASGSSRPLSLDINGTVQTPNLPFASTDPDGGGPLDGFNVWQFETRTVSLLAGENTLKLAIPTGATTGPNIDRIEITEAGSGPIDRSADEDAPLALTIVDLSDLAAARFALTGIDADIETITVAVGAGQPQAVTLTSGAFTLDLSGQTPGTVAIKVTVTDDAANMAMTTLNAVIEAPDPGAFDPVTIQAEAFTITDTTPGTDNASLTQARTPANVEPNLLANTGQVVGDADGDNLWDGYSGTGYLDFGGNAGDAASFVVDVPEDGVYTLTFRYANGGGGANPPRPLALSVDSGSGEQPAGQLAFAGTGADQWSTWAEEEIEVTLETGANTIKLAIPAGATSGPNIDRVIVSQDSQSEPGPREVVRINFQDGTTTKAAGYLVDNFNPYGDRGNGETYGWVTEASAIDATPGSTPISGTYPAIAINERTGAPFDSYDPRLTGYAHFDLNDYPTRAAWEIALEDGFYEVTVSVGDTGGANDSNNQLYLEGALATSFTPTNQYKSQLLTKVVEVTDGALTLSAQTGTITEVQYLEIRELPDLTPADADDAPADYASLKNPVSLGNAGQVSQAIGIGPGLRPDGIDPTHSIALDIEVVSGRGGVLETSLNSETIKLYETLTGAEVDFSVNTTGGFDAVVINPDATLKANTSYTLVVDGLLDRGPNGDPDGAPRELEKFSTTFVTGELPAGQDRDVAFSDQVVTTGAGFSSVVVSPDGQFLYATTLFGKIHRWTIDQTTGALSGEQSIDLPGNAGRALIGIAFDPNNPTTAFLTSNNPVSDGDPFTGKIVKATFSTGATLSASDVSDYVTGLPRSSQDHLSNSLAFRANPNAGQAGEPSHLLYLIQGSNTAMGAPDSAWGYRPETLLSAAVLEIDPTRTGPAINVQTEQFWTSAANSTFLDPLNDPRNPNNYNANGTVTGFYDPFAADAPVTIYATGARNAYDLVWHTNGFLYVPTNGSAGGANAPDNPNTAQNEGLTGIPTRNDYLFKVEEDGFYGHPNPVRGEFILNGGNPTGGTDPAEVTNYAVGTQPDPDYKGFAFDFGRNVSPNGAVEFTSDVFGNSLKGAVIVSQYSGPDNLIALRPGANGDIATSEVLTRPNGSVISLVDPLDVALNPVTGQLYVITFDRTNFQGPDSSQLVVLTPQPGGVVDPPPPTGQTIQAETGVLVPGAQSTGTAFIQVKAGETGFNGTGYVDFGDGVASGETLRFDLAGVTGGEYELRIRYSLNGTDRALALNVNTANLGPVTFTDTDGAGTLGFSTWANITRQITLGTGANTIAFTSNGTSGPNIDEIELVPLSPPGGGDLVSVGVYQSESQPADNRSGVLIVDQNNVPAGDTFRTGANGPEGGYADFPTTANAFIEYDITLTPEQAGLVELHFRYANGGTADRPLEVLIDGIDLTNPPLEFDSTIPTGGTADAGWTNWQTETLSVNLTAGTHVVRLATPQGTATGPNVDQLEIFKVLDPFTPVYQNASVTPRIEREDADSARVVTSKAVDFYFTVATDGFYQLEVAADAGAPAGGEVSFALNNAPVGTTDFPGAGPAGEEFRLVELEAGTEYRLRVSSENDGANALDYLDVTPFAGNANADIVVQSLDPAYFDDRIQFSYLANNNGRSFKDTGQFTISNTGTAPLTITDFDLSGPFKLANPTALDNLTVAAGQTTAAITVMFDPAAYTGPTANNADSTFKGEFTLYTNDAEDPIKTIDLAGFWQAVNEGGNEPSVNEIWEVFGFGTFIEGVPRQDSVAGSPLNNRDIYEAVNDDEVLSPYWRVADGASGVKITQIAAFHGDGGANFSIHNPGNEGQQLGGPSHQGTHNQRFLPLQGNGTFGTVTWTNASIPDAWQGNDAFGLKVADFSTDPRANPTGPTPAPNGEQQGHFLRIFVARDADGNVIENTYLGIQDYTGINYDYNDNVIVIEGVAPLGFGQSLVVSGLDASAADDRLVFSRIGTPVANQQFHSETTITLTNDGFQPLTIQNLALTGADAGSFQIVSGPAAGATVAAGQSVNVLVRYNGVDPANDDAAVLHEANLVVTSNAFGKETTTIALAGLAQIQSEGGEEPTVAQIVEAFGYGTDVAQADLDNGGLVEIVGDEVLMPYLTALVEGRPVEIIQLAAYLQNNDVARLSTHGLDGVPLVERFAQDNQHAQTVSPEGHVAGNGDSGQVAKSSFLATGPFGIKISVDNKPTFASWSDPEANDRDPAIGSLIADGGGHLIRFFTAKDADGNVIPGTFIGIQDYTGGGNFDYNDHVFVIRNVKPYNLTVVNDANANGVNDKLETNADNDALVDFFDLDDNPPPPPPPPPPPSAQTPANPTDTPWLVDDVNGLTLDGVQYDDGGQGVAYNDSAAGLQGGSNGGRAGSSVEVTTGGAIGWIADGEWLEYTINVEQAGSYELSFLRSLGDATGPQRTITASFATTTSVYEQSAAVVTPFTQNWTSFAASAPTTVDLAAGTQVLRVTFNGGSQDFDSFTLKPLAPPPPPPTGQQPFPGPSAPTLGSALLSIDATNFDSGGEDVAFNDATPGVMDGGTNARPGTGVETVNAENDIGYVKPGEWLEYTVNVAQAGVYNLALIAKSPVAGSTVALSLGSGPALATVTLPDANGASSNSFDGTTFASTTAVPVSLGGGLQTLRLTFNGPLASNGYVLDLRSFSLQQVPAAPPQAPFGGTPVAIGAGTGTVTIDATNFDTGGEDVAYNDATPGAMDGGTNGRPGTGVETVNGQHDIGYVKPGEWLEYTVDVAQAGTYQFALVGKAPTNAAKVSLSVEAGPVLGAITLPDANSATNNSFNGTSFGAAGPVQVQLAEGTQTLRLTFDGPLASNGYVMDVRSFSLTRVQTPFGGTPAEVDADGVTVLARNYDDGGQGVAYNDSAAGLQGGSNGGRSGSSVEITAGGAVGWIANGEWLEYTIDVATAGAYTLSFLRSLGIQGGSQRTISASFIKTGSSAYETSGAVVTPFTQNWSNFIASAPVVVDLDAGQQVVRIAFSGGAQDLQSFTLTPLAPVTPTGAATNLEVPQTLATEADQSPPATDADGAAGVVTTLADTPTEPVTLEPPASPPPQIVTPATAQPAATEGADVLTGTARADILRGRAGDDRIDAKGGADKVWGGADDDVIRGGAGNDHLHGDSGNDKLFGQTGADVIWGGSGADKLFGGDGRDILRGQGGNDLLFGQAGSDRLYADAGSDRLDGGADFDIVFVSGAASRYQLDEIGSSGRYRLIDTVGDGGTDTLIGVEQVRFSDGAVMI